MDEEDKFKLEIGLDDIVNSSEKDKEVSIPHEVTIMCLEYGLQEADSNSSKVSSTTNNTMLNHLKIAVELGYFKYWKHSIEYMKEKYNIELTLYTYLIVLYTTSDITDYQNSIVSDTIRNTVADIANKETEGIKKDNYFDDVSFMANMDDNHKHLLQRFFYLFNTLGVFYNNKNEYETKEERDKYDELMKVYYLLTAQ